MVHLNAGELRDATVGDVVVACQSDGLDAWCHLRDKQVPYPRQ